MIKQLFTKLFHKNIVNKNIINKDLQENKKIISKHITDFQDIFKEINISHMEVLSYYDIINYNKQLYNRYSYIFL